MVSSVMTLAGQHPSLSVGVEKVLKIEMGVVESAELM